LDFKIPKLKAIAFGGVEIGRGMDKDAAIATKITRPSW
jgi:hypothetical protein